MSVVSVDLRAPYDAAVLDRAERARAARFRLDRDRRRFEAARSALRRELAARLAVSPEAIRFVEGEHGKPAVEGRGAEFNVSHSGDVAVLAFAPAGVAVGVDIEFERGLRHDGLARRFFSPAEVSALAALPEEERRSGFFRCWTRKEAFVKATGVGLSRPLSSFDVSVDGPAALLAVRDAAVDPGEWSLHDLAAPVGAWAALAVHVPSAAGPVAVQTGHHLAS